MSSGEKQSVTKKLVDFILNTEYDDIPEQVVERAKLMIIDNLGVQLAAAAFPIGKIIKDHLQKIGGEKRSTVTGIKLKTSCINAAWANGCLGHALDMDDGDLKGVHSHPTSKTLPSVLSVGELVKANGKEVLTAFILGTETQIRVASAVNPSQFEMGFHTAGTVGVFGAAAAAGKLLRLDENQMLNALGIAGSAASGLRVNFGSMTKCFHTGHAAEQGVKAALLAKEGWEATKEILEGRYGYCQVMSREYELKKAVVLQHLGKRWEILDSGIYFKRYPGCGALTSIYGMIIHMAKKYDINQDDIELVEVGTDALLKVGILVYSQEIEGLPTNSYEARYSVPAAVAVSLLKRKVEAADLTDEYIRSPKVVELMKKVRHYIDPNMQRHWDWPPTRQTFRIVMKDGREYCEVLESSKTWPKEAKFIMEKEEVLEKFRNNAKLTLSKEKIEETINLVNELERLRDVTILTETVSGS
jgi:2-methylcitrate dehydratase PrpD